MERGRERDDRPRRRSRSVSDDSEEERRRRRRRKERERERGKGRAEGDRRRRRSRSRSRSPAHQSSRRGHEERQSKHESTRERSPYRRSKDREEKGEREGSAPQVGRRAQGPLPSQASSFQAGGNSDGAVVVAEVKDKQMPNFNPSGLLAAASNSVTQADGSAIALKYHEPAEARKPPARDEWKLFVFKGEEILETINLGLRSCWLVGKEVAVVDLPAEHPSVSRQHAVFQFRHIEKKNEFGDKTGRVKPYILDLESANGTMLNKEMIPPSRYLELRDKDLIQFGHSTREYVLMLSKA